jgi:hypothetical protein
VRKRLQTGTFRIHTLASLTGGDRSIGIVRLRTKTVEFFTFMKVSAASEVPYLVNDKSRTLCDVGFILLSMKFISRTF